MKGYNKKTHQENERAKQERLKRKCEELNNPARFVQIDTEYADQGSDLYVISCYDINCINGF